MFFKRQKLPSQYQQSLALLQSVNNKGQCYLEIYQNQQSRTHSISLLQHIDMHTFKIIKQQLQTAHSLMKSNELRLCKQITNQIYSLRKDYLRNTKKKQCALFGIFFFSLINFICLYGLWQVALYIFEEDVQKSYYKRAEQVCSWMGYLLQTQDANVLLNDMNESSSHTEFVYRCIWGFIYFIFASYTSLGLWHSTVFFVHSLDSFIYRRKKTIEFKNQIITLLNIYRFRQNRLIQRQQQQI